MQAEETAVGTERGSTRSVLGLLGRRQKTASLPFCGGHAEVRGAPGEVCTGCLCFPKDGIGGRAKVALSFPLGPLNFAFRYLGDLHGGSFCSHLCSPKDGAVKREKGSGCNLGQVWGWQQGYFSSKGDGQSWRAGARCLLGSPMLR